MHKASKEMRQALPNIDLIIEVLDARIPFSSQNPMLGQLRDDKPCIKILNKNDLADPLITQHWQDYFEREQYVKTLSVSNQHPETIQKIAGLCRKLLPEQIKSDKVIRAMIMGIPNVGKSTIINIVTGKMIAKTGNEPAVTKRQQRNDLCNNIILSDTPGVLWANLEHPNTGYRLAITGAIKDTAIAHDDVSFFAGEYLLKHYPDALQQRYQLENLPNNEAQLMEAIARKRGCIVSKNQIDWDKAAKILLTEFRAGKLGKITLETPDMMEKELDELIIIREKRAEKIAARKKRRHN